MTSEVGTQIIGYIAAFIYGSFFEWTLHRFVMHKRQPLVPYPFELHAIVHHRLFQADHTFHAQDEKSLEHVTFVPRDYLILLCVNTPLFLLVEWLTGYRVALGGALAVLTYLCLFDSIHWMMHVPRNRFIEKFPPYLWLKRHHLLHHRYQTRNLNVVCPLADYVLGTRVAQPNPGARILEV